MSNSTEDEGPEPSKPVVLIVDDDPLFLRTVELQLQSNFSLLHTLEGREAVSIAEQEQPDVIVLDIMMPEMDGRQVLAELNEHETTRDIPVVVLTALGAWEDRVELLENGAVDFMTKPADPGELIARITGAARTRARELARSQADRVQNQREEFMSRLEEEVARSSRSNSPLSVLHLATRETTEEYGSAGQSSNGQAKRASAVLRSSLRLGDSLFHLGGNEFTVILPDTAVATGFLVAERCRKALDQEEAPQETASVGVAEFSPGHGAMELAAKAASALTRARESGGGRSWRADDRRRTSLNTLALSEELTEREWDVLRHLAFKRSEIEIAKQLGIQAGTVRSHKARIRRKLQIAPSVRLTDFARTNLQQILDRRMEPSIDGSEVES